MVYFYSAALVVCSGIKVTLDLFQEETFSEELSAREKEIDGAGGRCKNCQWGGTKTFQTFAPFKEDYNLEEKRSGRLMEDEFFLKGLKKNHLQIILHGETGPL